MPSNRIAYSVYAWDFRKISGVPDLAGMQLKRIEKAGRSGYAFKEMGFRAESTEIYGEYLASSLGAANSFVTDMKALMGTAITLYDAHGVSWPNLVVERTNITRRQRIHLARWQGTTYTQPWIIQLQMTVTYPYGS